MFQDQDRGFARDPRNLSEHELIGDQVSEYGNRGLGKGFHDFSEAIGFFGMPSHRKDDFLMPRGCRSAITRNMASKALSASAKSILTGTTDSGDRAAKCAPKLMASFSVVTKPPASLF